jgi:hypothetical protein
MPFRPTRLRLERLENRATPAGNVLAVIHSANGQEPDLIKEFAPDGSLVRTLTPPRAHGARDLIVGPNGDIHLYVGEDHVSQGGPYPTELNRYHAASGSWSRWTVPNWSTFGVTHYGGVAAYGDYVYVTDMETGNETAPDNGIIRFNMANQTFQRFTVGIDYNDLAIGLDGVLYAMRGNNSEWIDKYHPLTMAYIDTLSVPGFFGGMAAAADGTIYLVDYHPLGYVIRVDPAGNHLDPLIHTHDVGSDVNVARDGTVLARDALLNADLTNPRHLGFSTDHVAFADAQMPDRMPILGGVEPDGSSVFENDAPVTVSAGIEVWDDYSPTIRAATVAITRNFEPGDALAFTPQDGITGSYDPATGILTLTGLASTASYQALFRSVTYAHVGDNPSDLRRSFTFQVDDGIALSNKVARNIMLWAVNDAPVIHLPAVPPNGPEGSDIRLSGLSVTDVDARTGIVSLGLFVPTGTVRFADLTGLAVFNGANNSASMWVRGTLAAINAALRDGNLVYHPPAGFSGTVTLTIVADDVGNTGSGGGQWWDTETLPITVQHRPPLLFGIESKPAVFVEGPGKVRVTSRLSAASTSGRLAGATVAVASNFSPAEDRLTWKASPSISGNYDSSLGVLTLDGEATVAQYRTALRSVRYSNVSQDPSPAARAVLFQVTDGAPDGWSNGVSRLIHVKPVNTPPVLTMPAVRPSGPSDTDLAIDGIRAADVDARGGVERLTLRVTRGTIRLASLSGLTVVGGVNGSRLVVVEGTLDRLNAALAGDNLVYRPPTGFAGLDTLTVTLNDLGLTGSGGARTTTRAIRIQVG